MDWAVFLCAFATLGAAAGFMAGLLGVGGGIILVPGLYFLLAFLGYESDVLMHVAVGTSLAIIVPTGFSSARSHWKKGSVDMSLVKNIGIGIVIGVVVGTITADILPGQTLKMIFASALIVLCGLMFVNPQKFSLFPKVPPQPFSGLVGGVIGSLSTLIGIGGASISVPFMSMCKVPIRKAIGSASAMGLVISVPAALGFIVIGLEEAGRPPLSLGFVNMPAWALIIPISVMIAPLGAKAAHKISVEKLRKVFAVFMVIVALRMWHSLLF